MFFVKYVIYMHYTHTHKYIYIFIERERKKEREGMEERKRERKWINQGSIDPLGMLSITQCKLPRR